MIIKEVIWDEIRDDGEPCPNCGYPIYGMTCKACGYPYNTEEY